MLSSFISLQVFLTAQTWIHKAKVDKSSSVWIRGTGSTRREFMHVEVLAYASFYLMTCYDSKELINTGTGTDTSVRDLAQLIAKVVGNIGGIGFDDRKPDGMPQKLLDVS